jgi:hypothetical protein
MKGEVRVNIKPRQLYGSITDTPTSQVRVRHVFVLTADRRTDLVGGPLLYVHPTISMTRCCIAPYSGYTPPPPHHSSCG